MEYGPKAKKKKKKEIGDIYIYSIYNIYMKEKIFILFIYFIFSYFITFYKCVTNCRTLLFCQISILTVFFLRFVFTILVNKLVCLSVCLSVCRITLKKNDPELASNTTLISKNRNYPRVILLT